MKISKLIFEKRLVFHEMMGLSALHNQEQKDKQNSDAQLAAIPGKMENETKKIESEIKSMDEEAIKNTPVDFNALRHRVNAIYLSVFSDPTINITGPNGQKLYDEANPHHPNLANLNKAEETAMNRINALEEIYEKQKRGILKAIETRASLVPLKAQLNKDVKFFSDILQKDPNKQTQANIAEIGRQLKAFTRDEASIKKLEEAYQELMKSESNMKSITDCMAEITVTQLLSNKVNDYRSYANNFHDGLVLRMRANATSRTNSAEGGKLFDQANKMIKNAKLSAIEKYPDVINPNNKEPEKIDDRVARVEQNVYREKE